MRVFVIWDLATPTLRTFLETLPEILPESAGEPIKWDIPGITMGGREVARDIILAGLREADQCIALLDRPSPSVGWQLGLALGLRKSLRLASLQEAAPAWTQGGALKGLAVQHLDDVAGMRALLVPLSWELPALPAADSAGARLILSPDGPLGSSLRAVALLSPRSRALPADGWGLYELPQLLAGCKEVVWILAPDTRLGGDNATSGVIAGFAEALGIPVMVLRSAEVPVVVDVQPRELRFSNLAEFKQKLEQLRTAPGPLSGSQRPARAALALASPLRSGRARRAVLLAAACFLIAGGVTLWQLQHRRPVAAVAEPAAPALASPAAPADQGPPPEEVRPPEEARSAPPAPPQAAEKTAAPRHPHAAGPPSCALSGPQLADLLSRIKDALFPEPGWRVYEEVTHDRCLTIDQLIKILDLFTFSDYKIKVMKLAAPRVRDRKNAERLKNILTGRWELQAVDTLFFPKKEGAHP